MPPPRVRIARSGRRLREVRVLEDDHPADQVDALAVRHACHLRGLVVVTDGARLPRERHADRREPDLTALVLDVELDRVQPVLRQPDVLARASPGATRARPSHGRRAPRPGADAGGSRPGRPPCRRRPPVRRCGQPRCSPLPASVIPPASASTTSSRRPTTAARRRRFRRRTVSRRARKRSFGSSDGIQHGHRVQQCSRSVSAPSRAHERGPDMRSHAAPAPATTPRGTPGALMSR